MTKKSFSILIKEGVRRSRQVADSCLIVAGVVLLPYSLKFALDGIRQNSYMGVIDDAGTVPFFEAGALLAISLIFILRFWFMRKLNLEIPDEIVLEMHSLKIVSEKEFVCQASEIQQLAFTLPEKRKNRKLEITQNDGTVREYYLGKSSSNSFKTMAQYPELCRSLEEWCSREKVEYKYC